MSSKVKELLDFIEPLGELFDTIEIEGANKENDEKRKKIHVNLNDFERMDEFGKENVIFGVNVVFKEDNVFIEFVHDERDWNPYKIQVGGNTYMGKRAKSEFLQRMNRKKQITKLESGTKTEPRELPNYGFGTVNKQVRKYQEAKDSIISYFKKIGGVYEESMVGLCEKVDINEKDHPILSSLENNCSFIFTTVYAMIAEGYFICEKPTYISSTRSKTIKLTLTDKGRMV